MKKEKFLYREEEIRIPTLHYSVFVVVTNNIAEAAARIKSNAADDRLPEFYAQAAALALHINNEGKSYILLPPNSDVGDIAHECWHVVRYIFEYVDAELENEMVAYHLAYLVLHTYDILKHLKRKKKR